MATNLMNYNYRNPKFCSDNIRIDCEIEHPEHGWIPFTCDPQDEECLFDVSELHKRMVASGKVERMTQSEIDAEAASRFAISETDCSLTRSIPW
jgi:hypothetical protein